MRRAAVRSIILPFLVAAPLAVLVPVNLYKVISGRGLEPLADNLFMYVVLLVVFGSAALVIFAAHLFTRQLARAATLVTYALAGSVGSTALLVFIDANDRDFTGPGVGWQLPMTGFVLGAVFGATLARLCATIERRSAT